MSIQTFCLKLSPLWGGGHCGEGGGEIGKKERGRGALRGKNGEKMASPTPGGGGKLPPPPRPP